MNNQNRTYFQPKVLRCPHCGGEITINAGHSARMIICSSCKTALDSYKGFKEYCNFIGRSFAALPLKIGMTGKIDNVEFIVTAVVDWREHDDDGMYQTYSFYLFSPTHGFCRIDRDHNFRYYFYRKVRYVPDPTPHKPGDKFKVNDLSFRITENGSEKISQVEGELPWLAKPAIPILIYLAKMNTDNFLKSAHITMNRNIFSDGKSLPQKSIALLK